METTSPVTTPTTTPAATSAAPRGVISSDFDTFLRMLTVQMQNQDPLNPMESSEFAVQLATFSGVEQQQRTNQLLEGLAGQMGMMGMAELAGWVGMQARAAMPAEFDGATPLRLSPNPAALADGAVLVVTDRTGAEVSRIQVPASTAPLDWDGTTEGGGGLPAGRYSFALESYAEGKLIGTEPVEVYGTITEARGGADGTVLVMQGGIEVPAGKITALRAP